MKALPVAAMVTGGVANQDEIKAQVADHQHCQGSRRSKR